MRINKLLAFGSVAALLAGGAAYEMRTPSGRVTPSVSVDMGHRPSAQSLMQAAAQNASPAVRRFYEQRGFAPAWTDDDGVLPSGQAALKLLQQAPVEGLPAIYAVAAPPAQSDAQTRIAFDMALTEAMLKFSSDLRLGQTDPTTVYGAKDVSLPVRHFDPAPAIANFVANGDAAAYLASLEPSAPDYSQLKLALAHYRAIAASGDWPQVNGSDTAMLGARLRREGYLDANATDPVQIRRALMAYQERNGLEPSGKLDATTRQMLAVPAAQRVIQILANMERWRWMPQHFEPRYIMVNIAGASLNLMENGAPTLSSRVVVGQPDKQTPILQTSAVAVTINPVWHVPASIIKNELMDKIEEDGGYLDRKNMTIKDGKIEQAPGPDNALGVIKFEMPNRLDIYLHDTPTKSAFRARNRALSHGCVRVEEIRQLAARALDVEPDALEQWIASGETLHRPLPSPIPVYMGYWTAIPGSDGTVGFRGDVYGRDETLIKALQEKSSPRQT